MSKRAYFCYQCENEFTVCTKATEPIEHCPFCASDLESADKDELEDDGG